MNCKKCGAPISETDAFCKNCGSLVGFDSSTTETTVNNTVSPIPGAIDFSIPAKEENGINNTNEVPEVKSSEPIFHSEIPTPQMPSQVETKPIEENVEQTNSKEQVVEMTNNDISNSVSNVVAQPSLDGEPTQVTQNETIQPVNLSSNIETVSAQNQAVINPEVSNNSVNIAENQSSITPVDAMEKTQIITSSKDKTLFLEDAEPELEIDEVKRSKKGIIIIAIIVIALLATGIFFAFQYISNRKSESEVEKHNVGKVDKYSINFGGYRLEIPQDYIYVVSGNKLYISDSQNTWYAAIQLADMSYSDINTKTDQISNAYQKQGFKISNLEEKEISGRKYYAVEIQGGEKFVLVTYTKADANRIFALTAYNPTYTIDYAILENISSILDSAVYLGEPGSITLASSIDVLQPLK